MCRHSIGAVPGNGGLAMALIRALFTESRFT